MNKYEKIMASDSDKKESVLQILRLLNGESADDAKLLLDTAKYFINACATFNVAAVEDWVESLPES